MRIGSWIKLAGLAVAVALGLGALTAGQAAAQPASEPYQSPMRAQCEAELAKDARWRAELEHEMLPVLHERETSAIVNNNRHVVMAYAALWVLVVFFILFMWVRQRRLQEEIERLEREVAKASEEP
jgi:CcmD family protein